MVRFTGTVKRCPNSPYFIFKDKEHFHTFKHEELENHNVLDIIVDLLNSVDNEVVLLKSDVESLSNPNQEYKYNINLLRDIREDCKEQVKKEWGKNFNLRVENKELKEENQRLERELLALKNYLLRWIEEE